MRPSEKDDVMKRFISGETNILVSTTVIEVGVNVPNATLMVIENAERFGLSQLHQLRGRVGRSSYQSYCIMFNDSSSEVARERMKVMTETSEAYYFRKGPGTGGPGDFFGQGSIAYRSLK